jgi:2-keto-4-pentenoate hydratase
MNHEAESINTLQGLADRLFDAESSRRPVLPLTEGYPDLSLEDAYRIQQLNIERRIRNGESIIGHKIGLTGAPMQEKFGVNEPDYGHLMNTMLLSASGPLDLSPLIDPQIEVEPAFILARELAGPGLTVEDVIEATDYVVACYEVIDSRIINWRIKLQDTVADNGSSARFILGSEKVKPDGLKLDDLDTRLEFDGQIVDTGNTRAILGHPARGIAWLGNKLAEFGIKLEAGHIVLPGTCIRSFRLLGHGVVKGSIAGLGSVAMEISGTPSVTSPED